MLWLSCQNLSKSYGSRLLFKEISFGISSGDKIGLIGPNGSGKSTLLKILAGQESSDEGNVVRNRNLRIGYVPQESLFPDLPLRAILFHALEEEGSVAEGERQTRTAITLSKMGFSDQELSAASLSGGWIKRLALAVALVAGPDLVLLDEPTNHLDLEGVIWLERFLQQASFGYLLISHDRYFLEHTTQRMMELDKSYPKGLFAAEGSYSAFLEKREAFLNGQLQQERGLNAKVRREVEWLRQNPKARTTKSQSRIQEAERLIGELQEVKGRNTQTKSQFAFAHSAKESRKLLSTNNLTKSMGGKLLFSGIDLILSPGVRLGVVGINGSGKTTFLRLLAGQLIPDKGTIKCADGLNKVYFDQHRAQLPPDVPLRRALAPDGDRVVYRGQTIHVNAWCRRFLFSPERLDLPFGHLSGGEKARVHIARLMLEPADLLLLDEPTNDLDMPTLEVLENSLLEFPGAIVLISHDRYLLDSLSTLILGLSGAHGHQLLASYPQWEQWQFEQAEQKKRSPPKKSEKVEAVPTRDARSRGMTYAEKYECQQMEKHILLLEKEIGALEKIVSDPAVSSDASQLQEVCEQLNGKHRALETLYQRWQELEALGEQSGAV